MKTVWLSSRARVMVGMSQLCRFSRLLTRSQQTPISRSAHCYLCRRDLRHNSSSLLHAVGAMLTPGSLRPLLVADSALTQSTVS